jgi:hypothetical protein
MVECICFLGMVLAWVLVVDWDGTGMDMGMGYM